MYNLFELVEINVGWKCLTKTVEVVVTVVTIVVFNR